MFTHSRRPHRLAVLATIAAVVLGAAASTSADAQSAPQGAAAVRALGQDTSIDAAKFDLYTVRADEAAFERLRRDGRDIVAVRPVAKGLEVDLVLSAADARALKADARLALTPWRDPRGRTASQLAAAQAADGYQVWRSYDQPGGFKDQAFDLAKRHPRLLKVAVIGFSDQGRPIVAVKLTRDANRIPDGTRPAVLYVALQHAREWIGPEVAWRLVKHLIDGYGHDARLTRLVDERELWFVPVANPDGYEHTFTPGNRLWRKTLRDNNGNGAFDPGDGVDANRNYPSHWGYDDEGSGAEPASWTYRGPAPASEPETQAITELLGRVPFTFMVNYHSVAELILYGLGWQVETTSPDTPLHVALAGAPGRPAIPGFKPQLSARLYTTNGETCDTAISLFRTTCFTPELSDGGSGGGFVFPDDEALVEAEFVKNLPFALDLADSAGDPSRPVSHLGNGVEPFYVDPFPVSYGDPQPVQVDALRRLGDVTLHYRIGDGPARTAPTQEWDGGERYGDAGDIVYRRLRGAVRGARPGDVVTVWFSAGATASRPFSYTLASDSGARVLVLAAEDYTGIHPTFDPPEGPRHLAAHLDALAAAGLDADVYDIDARGRVAPHPLGVLGHYAAVLWYTGDDIVTAHAGMGAGNVSKLAHQTVLGVRDYLNEGGRVLLDGQWAGMQHNAGLVFDDDHDVPCTPDHPEANCVPLSNDFLQYYLGAYSVADRASPGVTRPNRAGAGGGWWSDAGDLLDHTATRSFDLTTAAAPVVLSFDAVWQTEADYDFGYVEASTDGTSWTPLPDMDGRTTTSTVEGDANLGPGLNGAGHGRLRYDLGAYAGTTVQVRLRYLTDYAYVQPGWWIDNLAIDAAGGSVYTDSLDGPANGWTLVGWRATPETTPAVAVEDGIGTAAPLSGLSWAFAADGQAAPLHTAALGATSAVLPLAAHPQFDSGIAAHWAGDAAPDGAHIVYSGVVAAGYLRLTRTFDLSSVREASLSLRLNYSAPAPFNAVFVEARTDGQDDWTTLPDRNGHTRPTALLGACRTAEWLTVHPHLAHYLTRQDGARPPACTAGGSSGAWHAAGGTSTGWETWDVDLGAFAGRTVEVSISYVSWATSAGVRIDAVSSTTGEATSFETDLGGWRIAGPPPGSPPNAVDFTRAPAAAYPIGAAIVTPRTAMLGFGLEGLASAETRRALVGRLMAYLLPSDRRGRTLWLPWAGRP